MNNLWMRASADFATMLHGEPPWPALVNSSNQVVRMVPSLHGMGFLFVHWNRGISTTPGFTSLNVDLAGSTDPLPRLPHPPTAVFRFQDRTAIMWILEEPVRPGPSFFRRQEMLNVLLGTPQDKAGLARLLPLPGNDEFPCDMELFDPSSIYSLDRFLL